MKIGIDVGGSHIGLGILGSNNELLYKNEKDYPYRREDMSNLVVKTILELIKKAIEENKLNLSKLESIGVAIPGTVSEGTIVRAENLGIENLNLKKEIKKEFDIPIFLQNDANCAAIAEQKLGSLKGYDDSIFLIIGTGVGGAVILNGKLLKPKRFSGFEIGHMVISQDGERCNCGRIGCFETYGSIKRFKEKLRKEFNLPDTDGENIGEFINQNIKNEKLESMINKYIDDLNVGITNLINLFEPEAISIGGSFAFYKVLFEKLVERIQEKNELFNKESMPKFVVAKFKNDAGIIGAAMI